MDLRDQHLIQQPRGLFNNIIEGYGIATHSLTKTYITNKEKLASLHNRKTFLTQYRRKNLFPNHIIKNISGLYNPLLYEHTFKQKVSKVEKDNFEFRN